jgi:hypothetical protein
MDRIYRASSLHVIESLGELANEPGKRLAARLRATQETPIAIEYHPVFDVSELEGVLNKILKTEAEIGLIPILHFECHGGPDGIVLRDETTIPWETLGRALRTINLATRFNLIVIFACCDGIYAISGFESDRACPFAALVGCEGTIHTSELLAGYERFYTDVLNQASIERAVEALQEETISSISTRHVFYPCERAFILVLSNLIRESRNVDISGEMREHFRKKWDYLNALRGKLIPATSQQVDALIQRASSDSIRDFYKAYFAILQVPENGERYQFERMVMAAEEHLRLQSLF